MKSDKILKKSQLNKVSSLFNNKENFIYRSKKKKK